MPTTLPAPPTATPRRAIAVVGAGAVGSYFGALLALAGHPVTLIGRLPHVQAVQRDGLRLLRHGGSQTLHPAASTELAAVRGAGLVLVCVKAGDTEAVAQALAPLLDADALVLSLQNGVDNVATLARHLHQPVLPVVVYAATALPAPGVVQHLGGGELVIGAGGAPAPTGDQTPGETPDEAPSQPQSRLHSQSRSQSQSIAALFAGAGITVRVSDDATTALWAKLVVNCACNAVSALAQARYAEIAALPAAQVLQRAAVHEAVAVARAEGHALVADELLAAVARVAATMPTQRSSTAQDLARGRPTEIDFLNGHIVRRGAALGIATPVNQALLALVQLAETSKAAAAA